MKVNDVMVRDVRTCDPDINLENVAMIMWNNDIGAVPVVDQSGRPFAVITDRDITMATALNHKPLWEMTPREVTQNRPLYTCNAQDDIKTALKIMWAQKVRRLPVVNGTGQLQGILSIDDVITLAERGIRGQGAPELSYDDAMNALKAVSKHHH